MPLRNPSDRRKRSLEFAVVPTEGGLPPIPRALTSTPGSPAGNTSARDRRRPSGLDTRPNERRGSRASFFFFFPRLSFNSSHAGR